MSKILSKIRLLKEKKERILDSYRDSYITLWQRIKYAHYGFNYDDYKAYNFPNNSYKDYISYWDVTKKCGTVNGDYNILLGDKILFRDFFGNHLSIPKNYAMIENGIVSSLGDFHVTNSTFFEFIYSIAAKGEVFVKPISGAKGKDAHIVRLTQKREILIDYKPATEDGFWNMVAIGSFLVCEVVYQSDFANDLYPYSVNSIRIVIGKNKNESKSHVLAAAQRIGTNFSRPVDNVSQGGLSSVINIGTGELSPAIARVGKNDSELYKKHYFHPDTGAKIAGMIVPGWSDIVFSLEKTTDRFPYFKFIAWDVVLTRGGGTALLREIEIVVSRYFKWKNQVEGLCFGIGMLVTGL